jgi:hypothetical protein
MHGHNILPAYYRDPQSARIMSLRVCPEDFFDLEQDLQNAILENTVGPEVGIVFEPTSDAKSYPLTHVSDSIAKTDIQVAHLQRAITKLKGLTDSGRRLLCILRFFRVKNLSNCYVTESQFERLIGIFPFGCMASSKGLTDSERIYRSECFNYWLMGVHPAKILGYVHDAKIFTTDAAFQKICESIPYHKISATDAVSLIVECGYNLLESIYVVPGNPFHKTLLASSQMRVKLIIDRLCSISLAVEEPPNDSYPYLFMTKWGLRLADPELRKDWNRCSFKTAITRPRWTKDTHHFMDRKFKNATLTVLLMRKFCYEQFPMHKDLVPMFLEYLFSAHLDSISADLSLDLDLAAEY